MAGSLNRVPTQSEIIESAAAQGHNADIHTNTGSMQDESQIAPPPPSKGLECVKLPTMEPDKDDVEKGASPESLSSEDVAEKAPEKDQFIVFWDSPNDPQNPMNWSARRKWGAVSIISCITFLTPLASSMFAPGVPDVMKEFNSTDDRLEGFMLSVYVLGFAFGPLIIAPLSEMYGRLPLYHVCNTFFVIFSIAAAVASNMTMFIIFRFLMGCFGGAPLVLGGGTIADLIPREQRGTAMVLWMMGPTIGPCVGPIISGFMTEALGWRWNFWFVAILGGAFTIMAMILMSESYAPVILERKARRLREETGNREFQSKLDSGLSPRDLFIYSIVRPTKMLTRSPICFCISLYCAITYTYLYILFTTFTAVFTDQYHWHGGVVGLSFLGIGVGSLLGQYVFTHYGNNIVAKHIARGDFRPEHRLYTMCWGGLVQPIGLFWYGWSVQAQAHYMVPIVGTGVVGLGLLMTFMPANTYLVDVFTVHAASAMAANVVLRSLMGALIPLSSQRMYAALGYGWGNSVLGFASLLLVPVPFVLLRYGVQIRARLTVKL